MSISPVLRRPFLKWVGGKQKILHHILPHLPKGERLVEPFAGGGAIFLNTDYSQYLLADVNPDLISLYKTLQKYGENFIDQVSEYFKPHYNTASHYYDLREQFNQRRIKPFKRAALFIYFNRHGYNGLCRYNKKGGFNVPFGSYSQPYFPLEELRYFHQKAQEAEFICQNFQATLAMLKEKDTVYCDPPYLPLTESASFIHYHSSGFSLFDHQELANLALSSSEARGVYFLISNHESPFAWQLYQGASLHTFEVQRLISSKINQRDRVKEVLAVYAPIQQVNIC